MSPADIVKSLGAYGSPEQVVRLLEHQECDEAHVLTLLRKRELATGVIESIARHDRWGRRHVIRTAIVNHPKAPRTLALRLLSLLFWKEQLKVATNMRLAAPLRVAAENRLKERLPELELGEKIALARRAPVSLAALLAQEKDARLVHALLHNPRLREMDVLGIVHRDSTPGPVLRVVASNDRWSNRPQVKVGLVTHRHTPVHVALSILKRLPRRTLRKLLAERELPPVVALSAERMLALD